MIQLLTNSLTPNERLWQAAGEGDGEGIAKALSDGAVVDSVDTRGDDEWEHATALLKAAACDADAAWCVKTLLTASADVTWVNSKGVTALMQAVDGGVEAVDLILNASEGRFIRVAEGPDSSILHAVDAQGENALMRAAASLSIASKGVVEHLLDKGANPKALNKSGCSAAQLADQSCKGKVAKVLREASGEPEPERVVKVKPDDPMAKDGWLGSANLPKSVGGDGNNKKKSKGSKKKKK